MRESERERERGEGGAQAFLCDILCIVMHEFSGEGHVEVLDISYYRYLRRLRMEIDR